MFVDKENFCAGRYVWNRALAASDSDKTNLCVMTKVEYLSLASQKLEEVMSSVEQCVQGKGFVHINIELTVDTRVKEEGKLKV